VGFLAANLAFALSQGNTGGQGDLGENLRSVLRDIMNT